MRPQRKEPDCHTKAIIAALRRWEDRGIGSTAIITHKGAIDGHIDAARTFFMGKYPTLGSRAMRNISFGNSLDGKVKGIGFNIDYFTGYDFENGVDKLRGRNGPIVVLDDAMLPHILRHGAHEELMAIINYTNARFEA